MHKKYFNTTKCLNTKSHLKKTSDKAGYLREKFHMRGQVALKL